MSEDGKVYGMARRAGREGWPFGASGGAAFLLNDEQG